MLSNLLMVFLIGFVSVVVLSKLARVFGITTAKLNFKLNIAFELLKKQLPISFSVAILEEVIFRFVFITIFGYTFTVCLLTSFIFSLTHFTHGMYKDVIDLKDKIFLFVGLFILGFLLYQIYRIPFANIMYHSAIITGVTFTTFFLKPEASKNWLWWDEGHRLIRTPAAWLIMLAGMLLILKLNNLNLFLN